MTRRSAICVLVGAWVLTSVSQVRAATVTEVEPNNTRSTAQNVDGLFTLESDPNITSSTSIPHATVNSVPNTNTAANYDYYSFTVTQANSQGIFDIDDAIQGGNFDVFLELFNSSGDLTVVNGQNDPSELAQDDDGPLDPGTSAGNHPFLTFTFSDPGTYFVRVGALDVFNIDEALRTSAPVPAGNFGYTLHLSVESAVVAVPEPTSLALLSVGMVTFAGGAAVRRRRKKNQASEVTAS